MSTLKVNTVQDAAGGNGMLISSINEGRAKSWLNMNGTGTIAIRDSFGISSLTDVGTGQYNGNFATPKANANFVAVASAGTITASYSVSIARTNSTTALYQMIIVTIGTTPTLTDIDCIFSEVLGDE